MGAIFFGIVIGFIGWFLVRYLVAGFYTVNQNERAVKTSFGRAERVGTATTSPDPIAATLNEEEKERYNYPQVRVIPPGGPYFKWPWEKVYKISVATQTINMAVDPENADANAQGTMLEAVTKDQLNTGLKGQIRWHVPVGRSAGGAADNSPRCNRGLSVQPEFKPRMGRQKSHGQTVLPPPPGLKSSRHLNPRLKPWATLARCSAACRAIPRPLSPAITTRSHQRLGKKAEAKGSLLAQAG